MFSLLGAQLRPRTGHGSQGWSPPRSRDDSALGLSPVMGPLQTETPGVQATPSFLLPALHCHGRPGLTPVAPTAPSPLLCLYTWPPGRVPDGGRSSQVPPPWLFALVWQPPLGPTAGYPLRPHPLAHSHQQVSTPKGQRPRAETLQTALPCLLAGSARRCPLAGCSRPHRGPPGRSGGLAAAALPRARALVPPLLGPSHQPVSLPAPAPG